MDKFTAEEIAIIKRFIDASQPFLGSDEGVTGYDDEGVTVGEWETEYSYGDSYLTKNAWVIPWIAFTDPEEHERQEEARRRESERRSEEQRLALLARREAEERSVLAALKAKYEPTR